MLIKKKIKRGLKRSGGNLQRAKKKGGEECLLLVLDKNFIYNFNLENENRITPRPLETETFIFAPFTN